MYHWNNYTQNDRQEKTCRIVFLLLVESSEKDSSLSINALLELVLTWKKCIEPWQSILVTVGGFGSGNHLLYSVTFFFQLYHFILKGFELLISLHPPSIPNSRGKAKKSQVSTLNLVIFRKSATSFSFVGWSFHFPLPHAQVIGLLFAWIVDLHPFLLSCALLPQSRWREFSGQLRRMVTTRKVWSLGVWCV